MVTDPTLYSVAIAAIAFIGFSIGAIVRPFNPPQTPPQRTIPLVLPEPSRPIGLLPAAPELPTPIAPPILQAALASPHRVADAPTTTQTLVAGLLAAPDTRPAIPAIAVLPTAPIPSGEPHLYRPVVIDGTTRMIRSASPTIPSPWEPESDRYWNHNATLTYPNAVPMLPGGVA